MAGPAARTASPLAQFDPIFATQATFRAVLDAMARPGTVRPLPVADPVSPLPETAYLTALLLTLLDHEVAFTVIPATDETPAARLASYLVETTGSRAVESEDADYVVALGPLPAGLPTRLRRGEPAYPDRGATLICLVPSQTGPDGAWPRVDLCGPGVPANHPKTLRLPGLTTMDLTAIAIVNAEPPRGIDLILIDDKGHVVCLPRSTKVTMSAE